MAFDTRIDTNSAAVADVPTIQELIAEGRKTLAAKRQAEVAAQREAEKKAAAEGERLENRVRQIAAAFVGPAAAVYLQKIEQTIGDDGFIVPLLVPGCCPVDVRVIRKGSSLDLDRRELEQAAFLRGTHGVREFHHRKTDRMGDFRVHKLTVVMDNEGYRVHPREPIYFDCLAEALAFADEQEKQRPGLTLDAEKLTREANARLHRAALARKPPTVDGTLLAALRTFVEVNCPESEDWR
ncbi:MAG: hypothetical protein ACRED1_12870 [Limisphaerales bacterium]